MTTYKHHKQELLVSGYVRNIERMYDIKNIPLDIMDIIYLYQQFCDKWSRKYSHDDIIIDGIKNTITFSKDTNVTAFGSHVAENGIFKWKIRIISISYESVFKAYPYVGIIKDDDSVLKAYTDRASWEYDGYQFCAGTGSFYGMGDPDEGESFDVKWNKPNDILEIILDLNQRTLEFIINEIESVVAPLIIAKGKYRLAIGVNNAKGAQFELY